MWERKDGKEDWEEKLSSMEKEWIIARKREIKVENGMKNEEEDESEEN